MSKPQKPLILIVDDVAQNLQVLGNILRENNYRVAAATSGQQALGILADGAAPPPDLILLDIMMPGIDGYNVAKLLKEQSHTEDIPIVFLTARTQTDDIVKGFETGAVDYITKPFNKAELLARVTTHLALRRAQKEIAQLEKKNGVLAMAITANHEINQPLTILQGNFEVYRNSLNTDQISEKQQRSLDKIQDAIQRIQNILEKFMNTPGIRFEEYLDQKEQVIFEP